MRTIVTYAPLLALIAALIPSRVDAQAPVIPPELALEAAVALGLQRNPLLGAAGSAVDAAEGQRLDLSRRLNPAVTFEAEGYPLFQSPRPSFVNGQELTLRVDQELELGGRRRLRTEVGDSGVAIAQAWLQEERRQVTLAVRRTYFDVVLAQSDLTVAQATLDEIDRVLVLNRARLDQGEISGIEVRRLQVERLRFVDDVFAAQLALRNARSALLALLNAPDLAVEFVVTESLALPGGPAVPPNMETAEAQAVAARPDLAAARRAQVQADTQTRLQRALRSPNITVGGGYRRDLHANAVVFGMTVPLQLFNRNQGGVATAVAEQRRASHLTDAAVIAVRLDVQQAINAAEVSAERVAYIEREYLLNAEQTRDTVLASYRLGAADLIDYLDAQRGFRETVRTYNRALYEHRISLFQVAAAIGTPIGEEE